MASGLPIFGSDVLIGIHVKGVGLLEETITEIEDFKWRAHMPVKERDVLGVDHVKLDQVYQKVTFSGKAFVKGNEALRVLKAKVQAYLSRRAQPDEALYVQERYRDAGGATDNVRLLNAKIEWGDRTYSKRDEYAMIDFEGSAEIPKFT